MWSTSIPVFSINVELTNRREVIMAMDQELSFRIRETAQRRERRSTTPLPAELFVNDDGSAVVSYEGGERLVRYESLGECLVAHDLAGVDLEPKE
jgi:hypothetical protein